MNSITPMRDPVTEPIAALLEVFDAHAARLCFPDVDHDTLRDLADKLREAAAEVERGERALAEARQAFDAHRAALGARAERGLAYARIFAADDSALKEQLEAIELTSATRPRATKKSGKRAPRKTTPRARRTRPADADESVTELPFSPDRPKPAVQAGVA